MRIDAAAVGRRRPACLGNNYGLAGIVVNDRVIVLLGELQRVVDGAILPGRVGMYGNEIEFLCQRLELVGPRHVVLTKRHRLFDRLLDLADVLNQVFDRDHVIGPLDAGLVANRYHEYDVVEGVGEVNETVHFRVVGAPVGVEHLVAVLGAPGTVRIAHFRGHVEPQHDLELQPLVADDLEHGFGMRAAVVQTHVLPVLCENQQVLANLVVRWEFAGVRALVLPVTRITDRVTVIHAQRAHRADPAVACLRHT